MEFFVNQSYAFQVEFKDMMHFVYFNDSSRLWDWINNNYSNTLYIAPSPAKADGLRTRLQGRGVTTDVLTVNKFLSDLIKERKLDLNLKRKSELYLIFGWLRSAYFPELTFEQFSNAYTLFSELRSFSLDLTALAPILEEQDAHIKRTIEFFWNILEQTGLHDEHSAYAELTQSLRGENFVEQKHNYVFWGFQHLNGLQIDFLKALAIREDVLIPFPASLKDKLKSSDWPSWLISGLDDIQTIDEEDDKTLTLKWRKTNSRELSLQLKTEIKPHDQVVLGVSKIEDTHLHLLPYGEVQFKVPHQLVAKEIATYFSKLEEMSFSDFKEKVREDLLGAIAVQNFKRLKVLQLIEEALASMDEITDVQPHVDKFFIYLLKEVVSLNQPRTSYISLNNSNESVELKSFGDIESLDLSRRIIFCLDERFGDLVTLGQRYSVDMLKNLSVLGPIKRSELDLEFKKWELREIIKNDNSLLLMPPELLKHSLSWSKILEGIEIVHEEFSLVRSDRNIKDYFDTKKFKKFEGHFSASKVRSYLECPRKFYFNYVEQLFPDVVLATELDPRVKGTLSHKIIELAIKNGVEDVSEIAKIVLDEEVKGLHLKDEDYQNNLIQLTLRSSNGLGVLKKIEEVLSIKANWIIEDRFSFELEGSFKGQIDCYAVVDNFLILLDFKSTSSAAPTLGRIRSFEDLQLWTYLLGLENKGIDVKNLSLITGYVVLDEPAKSILLFTDESLSKEFKPFYSANPLKLEITECLENVQDILNQSLNKMRSDETFLAKPLNKDVCLFCDFSRVCMKGKEL